MLNCGSSPALDSITGKVDEIKAKLAEGMSALGDLESKANEALAELQAALPEIPSAGPSLQGDVSALLAQMQTDAGGAIAAFKEAWGEAMSDGELQGYIDQVTAAISDPLSLASFDPCEAIPNKELDSATGEVVVKAKEMKIPSEPPAKILDFFTNFGSVVDLTQLPSSVSPAGTSRSSSGFAAALSASTKAKGKIDTAFTPKVRAANEAYSAEKKKPEYNQTGSSGYNGSGAAKRQRLYTTGRMTAGQVKWYENFLDLEIEYQNVSARRDMIKEQLENYTEFLSGRISQENFDKGEKNFLDEPRLTASDISLYETGKSDLDVNKADFQGVANHTNQVVSSVLV
jgi:hypothetical protein